jgi:hypothetical protein
MKFNTEYREKANFNGTKLHYIICKVEFSNEERAIIDERGMYDRGVSAPAAEPMPSAVSEFQSGCLKFFGFLIPFGLLVIFASYLAPEHGSATPGWVMLILGTVLCALGWMREKKKWDDANVRYITIRQLLSDPFFQFYDETLRGVKNHEIEVREELAELAAELRSSRAVPEQNTYEL